MSPTPFSAAVPAPGVYSFSRARASPGRRPLPAKEIDSPAAQFVQRLGDKALTSLTDRGIGQAERARRVHRCCATTSTSIPSGATCWARIGAKRPTRRKTKVFPPVRGHDRRDLYAALRRIFGPGLQDHRRHGARGRLDGFADQQPDHPERRRPAGRRRLARACPARTARCASSTCSSTSISIERHAALEFDSVI